jgi:hypothetical protein
MPRHLLLRTSQLTGRRAGYLLLPLVLAGSALAAVAALPTGAGATPTAITADPVSPRCNTAPIAHPESVVSTLKGKEVQATFNNPATHSGLDDTQITEMIRLIDCTPGGATIRMAIHSIRSKRVLAAITDAVNRKVTVLVVHNGADCQHRTPKCTIPTDLAALLKKNHRWCNTHAGSNACVSTAKGGIMHAKYLMFSQTRDLDGTQKSNVVWFGSPNMTRHSGTQLFNNSVTVYGDRDLYVKFRDRIWRPMWNRQAQPGNDFYAPKSRGYLRSNTTNIAAFASPDNTKGSDLVLAQLNQLHPAEGCQVLVMENMIHNDRLAVVNKLVDLSHHNCTVQVVAANVNDTAMSRFKHAHIQVHAALVHDKLILIKGRFGNVDHSVYTVLTGSHNLTGKALHSNDELLVQIPQVPAVFYDAFHSHFNDGWTAGTKCGGCKTIVKGEPRP